MKWIKIYETYFDDKLKEMLDSIKAEVDIYIYSLTDNYQTDSSEDYFNFKGSNGVELTYKNIKISSEDYDSCISKMIRIAKILEKDFDISFRGIQVIKPTKYWLDLGAIRRSLMFDYKSITPGEKLFGNYQEVTFNLLFTMKSETLASLY